MKTCNPNTVSTLLNYTNLLAAEIYTFTPASGNQLLYTSLDTSITIQGNTFESGGLLIKRGSIKQALGVTVDQLELTVYPTTANIAGVPFLAALRNGALDGAMVLLQRMFFKWWAMDGLIDTITMFNGYVSDIDPIGRTSATLKISSVADFLSVQWPRMVYAAQCVWRLYDAGCGVNRNSFTYSGSVTGNATVNGFSTSLNNANDYFDQGAVIFTSGQNIYALRTVQLFSAGNVSIAYPLLNAPANNDTFNIYAGCDHQYQTCVSKFSNGNNFRGFPFIPAPESAY